MARQINYDLNIESSDAVRTLTQIEAEIQEVNRELREVATSSESFNTLSQRSQTLQTELGGVNRQIDGITSEDRQNQLQGTIDIFTGAIETVSGLSAVLGIQDERLEQVIVQLLAVAQAANGIRTLTAGWIALGRAEAAATTNARIFNRVSRRNVLLLVASLAAAGIAYAIFSGGADDANNEVTRGLEDQLDAFRGTRLEQIRLERALLIERLRLSESDETSRELQRQLNRLATEANVIGETTIAQASILESQDRFDNLITNQRRQLDVNELLGDSESILNAQRVFDAQDNVERLDMEIDALKEADATKEEIMEAEVLRDLALDTLQEQLHQGNLIRIREEVEAEENKLIAERAITDESIGVASDLGAIATQISADNKELQITGLLVSQAAGIAGITISTVRAATAALAPPPTGLGPIGGIPLAALISTGGALGIASAVAATVEGINKINASGGPPASGGGGAGGGGGGPTVATPAGMLGMGGPMTAPQQSISSAQPATVVAVVAQGDIRNSGERDARSRRKARLNRRNNG